MSSLHRSYSPDQLSEAASANRPRDIRAAGPRADAEALRKSYLELAKLALCDLLQAETMTVAWTDDRRLFTREISGEEELGWRIAGRDWPLNALTMVGLRRLDDLQACVESVVNDGVEGDLVEAGAWRGGSSILMRVTLDSLGAQNRTVWVADSFQGFPAPEQEGVNEDRDLEADMSGIGFLAPSLDDVKANFDRFGCQQGVEFVPGFFEETMEQLRGRRWSVVRLDADTYKATRLTLEALYPGLEVGGYLISDDYAFLPACRRAVDEFRREHGITEPIEQIDWNGARWRREHETPSLVSDIGSTREPRPDKPPRAVVKPTLSRIPTGRELQLSDEVQALQAHLDTAEAEIEALLNSPLAGPVAWARRKLGRTP
jgi:O-methyltransferase